MCILVNLLYHLCHIISIMFIIARYDIIKTNFDIARCKKSTYDCSNESLLAEILMARWKGERSK